MGESDLGLRKFLAPEIVFGIGARNLVANYIKNYGRTKVFVVADKNLYNLSWNFANIPMQVIAGTIIRAHLNILFFIYKNTKTKGIASKSKIALLPPE